MWRSGSRAPEVAPALNFIGAAGNAGYRLRVGDVLFRQDARGEGVAVVVVVNRDNALQDDDAVVEVLVDEVNRAAGHLDAVIEGLLLGVEAREGGQQGRVNVEDAVGEG